MGQHVQAGFPDRQESHLLALPSSQLLQISYVFQFQLPIFIFFFQWAYHILPTLEATCGYSQTRPSLTPRSLMPLPGREAVLGFWGMEGRAPGLGLGDCRRGFGLVGMLEELRDLQPPSTLGSALAFFSGVPKPKRASWRPGYNLGIKMRSDPNHILNIKSQRN